MMDMEMGFTVLSYFAPVLMIVTGAIAWLLLSYFWSKLDK